MIQKSIVFRSLVVLTFVLAAACGDDEPTNVTQDEPFTADDQQALTEALAAGGFLGPAQGFAGVFVSELDHVGTFMLDGEEYHALAFRLDSDMMGPMSQLTGFAAWKGLDTSTHTFEELITFVLPGPLEEGGTADLSQGPFSAKAFVQQPGDEMPVFFISTSGSFTLTALELGDPQDCGNNSGMTGMSCSVRTGTLDGSFDFEASLFQPDTESLSRSATFEDIPTVALTVTGMGGIGG